MKKNIALSGKSGSGKTTIAEYLVNKHGYSICNTGKSCREICNILFESESKSLLNKITDAIKQIDKNIWLKKALSEADNTRPIIFDSMRFSEDYDYFKSSGYVSIRIECHEDIIIERLNKRGQKIDPANDFAHKAETDLDGLEFDHTIMNNSSVDKFYEEIDSILEKSGNF